MLALRENALKNTTVPDSSWACGTDLMMVVVVVASAVAAQLVLPQNSISSPEFCHEFRK